MEDDGIVNIMIVLSRTSSVQFQVMINTIDVTAVGTYVNKLFSYYNVSLMLICSYRRL